jgi:hypothetical protein
MLNSVPSHARSNCAVENVEDAASVGAPELMQPNRESDHIVLRASGSDLHNRLSWLSVGLIAILLLIQGTAAISEWYHTFLSVFYQVGGGPTKNRRPPDSGAFV